jgi:hypothetical protein
LSPGIAEFDAALENLAEKVQALVERSAARDSFPEKVCS